MIVTALTHIKTHSVCVRTSDDGEVSITADIVRLWLDQRKEVQRQKHYFKRRRESCERENSRKRWHTDHPYLYTAVTE
jgi:hypothetical protein